MRHPAFEYGAGFKLGFVNVGIEMVAARVRKIDDVGLVTVCLAVVTVWPMTKSSKCC